LCSAKKKNGKKESHLGLEQHEGESF